MLVTAPKRKRKNHIKKYSNAKNKENSKSGHGSDKEKYCWYDVSTCIFNKSKMQHDFNKNEFDVYLTNFEYNT